MPSAYEYMTQDEIHAFITAQLELHQQSVAAVATQTPSSSISKWGYAIGAAVVVATGGYFALQQWKKKDQKRSVAGPKQLKIVKQKSEYSTSTEAGRSAAPDADRLSSELKERRNERLMRAGALVSVSMLCAAARLTNWKW